MEAASRIDQGFSIKAPDGKTIAIPAAVDDASDVYAALTTPDAVKRYYDEQGYVVCRNVIPATLCDDANQAFDLEVKPYPGFIFRQATANPERHVFTASGLMLNSILNLQDLSRRRFPRFRQAGLDAITHARLRAIVENLLGDRARLVQSMYFEGNPVTWAHQDTYYLDSAETGRMVAAWIALEDISPGAGRFYVYPRSHRLELLQNRGKYSIAFHHDRYKQHVLDEIRTHGLTCHAPALRQGDVLLWAARTIHGSLETTEPQCSRSSFTAHYIPASKAFLQLQSRVVKRLNLETINDIDVHHPFDQNRLFGRTVLRLASAFPRSFQLAKTVVKKALTG
jgi:phytanoyl-CoA hydroxylase